MMELCKNIVQLKIFDHFHRESPSKMLDRSSRPDMFCKKGVDVLRNFTKFTGKHLCESLFFNKVAGLRPEAFNFIKNIILAQGFSCEFCEISKNTFSYRTPPVVASSSTRFLEEFMWKRFG